MFVFWNLVTYCLFICCVFGGVCCSEEEKGSRNGSKVGDGGFRRLVKDCFGVRNEDVLLEHSTDWLPDYSRDFVAKVLGVVDDEFEKIKGSVRCVIFHIIDGKVFFICSKGDVVVNGEKVEEFPDDELNNVDTKCQLEQGFFITGEKEGGGDSCTFYRFKDIKV